MANYKISPQFKIYLLKYAASALNQTNSAMIQDITRGVPVENAASIADKRMPLPYCSKPMSAAAEPFISCGTLSRVRHWSKRRRYNNTKDDYVSIE